MAIETTVHKTNMYEALLINSIFLLNLIVSDWTFYNICLTLIKLLNKFIKLKTTLKTLAAFWDIHAVNYDILI